MGSEDEMVRRRRKTENKEGIGIKKNGGLSYKTKQKDEHYGEEEEEYVS